MSARIATIRSDFKMPDSPIAECQDCREIVSPFAYWTGDGLLLYWDCSFGCGHVGEKELFIEEWPFVEDRCTDEDLKAAGFTLA